MVRDSKYVRAYAGRYREIFPVRIVSILSIIALSLWLQDWTWAANYAVCQLGLYAVLWTVVERARTRPQAPGASLALKRWTEGVTLALAVHSSLFALFATVAEPAHLPHALLMICGHLVVGALQVHISRLSFAASVVPPVLVLAWFAWRIAAPDHGLLLCAAALAAGVLGAAWRQMVSDRQAVELYVDLAERSSSLQTALTEATAARAGAERANQAKSRFLAMISHDVRTPLNIMMGVTEVLKRRRRTRTEAELLTDMGDAGAMLLRLLNGALDLSKIESGQAEARLAPVDLRAGIEAMGRVWRHRARELGLTLDVAFDGQDADFNLLADEGRIEQVVGNLLSNALKMTPAGRVLLTVRARPSGDDVVDLEILVADQGPGVPEDMRERIFQPFEQLDDGRAAGGAGLGLAICRASVETMGGEIGVEPAAGGGAVFWFRIPARRAAARVVALPVADPVGAHTRRLTILAAEDHPANRKLLSMLLAQFEADVTLVENGAEAVAAARAGAFDLILMDVMMPVLDGVGALTAIRAAEIARGAAPTPVHMLTANVFDEDVARYMAAGAHGVLKKPIEIPALHAVLDAAARPAPEPLRLAG